ncbi:MAG: hypothetical protein FWE14_03365 [Lachnospiraceae bacterium]|nr:hypothetical protein [Lachnospiraceae bacterium]
MITNYNDFIKELLAAGFSLAGGKDEGVFGLIEFSWNEEAPDSPIRWHTGDAETDPWEWRMRLLNERNDIAYAKFFFKKGGFITKEWYPYFLAARRGMLTFSEEYEEGKMSHFAKRIYETVSEYDCLPLHEIKQLGGFNREDKSKFDSALTELQMRMYLTICGSRQKTSHRGENYAWASTVLCITEKFWGAEVFEAASQINANEAIEKITAQVFKLNPKAIDKKIKKFIIG